MIEEDFGREGFFAIDLSPTQEDLPEKLSEKEQYEVLKQLVQEGLYEKINPENFPEVPVERLVAEAVLALDTAVDRLQYAANNTPDSELRKMLLIMATHKQEEGSKKLKEQYQVAGEINWDLLRRQGIVRQSGDANNSMGLVINKGLVEELKEHSFPALRAMSPVSRYLLLMDTVTNRIKLLQEQSVSAPTQGFGQSRLEQSSPKDTNNKEIEFWKTILGEVIKKHSQARKEANWQIPEFE